jgi:hypothetical protein
LIDYRLRVRRIDHPPTQRVRHGPRNLGRALAHRHIDGKQPLQIRGADINRAQPLARFVERRLTHWIRGLASGRDLVQHALGVDLSRRQVAGDRGIPGPDADQLADDGKSAPQDGDRQDHLHQRQTAATVLMGHGTLL